MRTKGDEDERSMFVLLKSNGELSVHPIIAYVVWTVNSLRVRIIDYKDT